MTDRLNLLPRHRKELEALLRQHVPDAEVWAYGSRVNGRSHEASDLDLVLRGPDLEPLADGYVDLLEALEQSNIPILVQAHDWARLPESFHREIERDYLVVQEGGIPTTNGKWKEVVWGELATLEYGKSLRRYQTCDGPYKVYGTNGQIGWHTEPLATHASVIIGRKGAYRGVHYSADPFFVIDTAFYLKPKAELDTRWAYYQLLTQDINGMDSGSAIPSTSREDFYGLPVDVPPLPEQRRIANVLGALDDKIELNRRMNETLEAMARAIFQDWFVDFGPVRAKLEGREPYLPLELWDLFPDRLVDSELGEIPEGWEVKALGQVANLNPESWSKSNRPARVEYVDLANTKWGVIESTRQFLWKDAPSRARRILRSGDTIVGTVRPGNGSYSLIENDGLTGSTGFAVLQPSHPRFRELVFLSATAPDNLEWLAHRADGAAYPAVRPEIVSETKVAIPGDESRVLDRFSETVGVSLDRMESARAESRTLAALRDALLPKLVSGEMRVVEPRSPNPSDRM